MSAVLKDANLVDIDAVKGQVQSSKTDVVSGLTGTFVWRDVPTNPRNPYQLIRRINDTIDTALVDVDTLITKVRGRDGELSVQVSHIHTHRGLGC